MGNGPSNRKPGDDLTHQRVFQLAGYLLAGVLFAGSILGVIRNSQIVPPWSTYVGTFLILVSFLWLRRRLRLKPITWRINDHLYPVRRLGVAATLFAVGIVLVLWLPRLVDFWPSLIAHLPLPSKYLTFLQPKRVVILVADFDGPDPQNYRVTQNIYEALLTSTKQYPDLDVRLLHEPITFDRGSALARTKAAQEDASIILWGSYGKTAESEIGRAHV